MLKLVTDAERKHITECIAEWIRQRDEEIVLPPRADYRLSERQCFCDRTEEVNL